ncbi:MAG: transposase [Candidatus Shapirobacteria bacterium]|nr:transposase [Candidatus Shapirobacteria bacterium]MDD5073949.1 transposase [Candidatus Shapirobacteria bacterium]MDD5481899.1 transposase [Candidatus Shapirobacteria bacterium]
MPGRKIVLATDQVYHLFNRGNSSQPTFLNAFDYRRFLKTINFYRFAPHSAKLFQFLEFSEKRRKEYFDNLKKKTKELVSIFSFCLMPNHYHLLVRQEVENGISKFMSQLQNSYTKYFNLKRKKAGSLFQGHFKAVRAETDEQLIHLSRYIHLNPYSSYVVKLINNLETYPWSSLPDYLGEKKHFFVKKKPILDLFKNKKDYQKFVFDQADYQRELEKIKHLTWE